MKVKQNNPTDARTDRAAAFAARAYSGNAGQQDRAEIEQWLAESPENTSEYESVLDTWQMMGALADRIDELDNDEQASAFRQKLNHTESNGNSGTYRRAQRWSFGAIAASVLFAAVFMLVDGLNNAEKQVLPVTPALASYSTSTGQQKTVELPDGSVVTLNTNTRILIDFNDNRRRAILDRGEAFFEVVARPSQPFVVDTGSRAVTVLGTKFDVFRSGFDLQVSVVEGVVVVHSSQQPAELSNNSVELSPSTLHSPPQNADSYRLTAGVVASFSGNMGSQDASVTANPVVGANKFPGWRYGSVRFDDKSLSEVVKTLNRYTQQKILIEDSRTMDLKISGVFQLDTVLAELHKIERVIPVNVIRYPDRIVITMR